LTARTALGLLASALGLGSVAVAGTVAVTSTAPGAPVPGSTVPGSTVPGSTVPGTEIGAGPARFVLHHLSRLLHPLAGASTPAAAHWVAFGGLCLVAIVALVTAAASLPPLASKRAKMRKLERAARALSSGALPAILRALEARAAGTSGVPSLAGTLTEMETAARDLRSWSLPGSGGARDLARALSEASWQLARITAVVDLLPRADKQRLEELVGERTAALSSANRRLVDSGWQRRQLLDRTVRAAEGERSRLAASLHDGPIQRLAALGLVLDRCRLRLDRDDQAGAGELLGRARAGVSDEIRDLRQMMSELRPPVLDAGGLEAAIRDHLSAWSEATGIEASLTAAERLPLSPNSETVAYRIMQEALTNVAKHASAGHVLVSIRPSNGGVELVVRDDGKGFRVLSHQELLRGGHFGLVIMKERVELAAGAFELKSAPLAGAEVRIWLPAAMSDGTPDLGAQGPSSSDVPTAGQLATGQLATGPASQAAPARFAAPASGGAR
jgi:signal transduction histidine kinase